MRGQEAPSRRRWWRRLGDWPGATPRSGRKRSLRQIAEELPGAAAQREAADRHAANVLPIVREIQAAGITGVREIAKALNARGVRTVRGGEWHHSTVRNLLARERQ